MIVGHGRLRATRPRLVGGSGTRGSAGPPGAALDLPAGARRHLPFRVLLAAVPDPGNARPRGPAARRLLPPRAPQGHARAGPLLVRTHAAVVRERPPRAPRVVLDGNGGCARAPREPLAAG